MEKLLIITANQSTRFLEGTKPELRRIRDTVLLDAIGQHRIEVTEQSDFTYPSLMNYLNLPEGKDITMMHYIGHSSEEGILIEWDNGQTDLIPTEALCTLLQERSLRLIFLNSCSSEKIARQLVDAGVPYVIGTGTSISDEEAIQVAKKFYELLGNVDRRYTIQKAFDQTLTYFELAEPGSLRTAFRSMLSTAAPADSATFPWQIYHRDDLTDEQRNWRLIPIEPVAPVVPTEANELYAVVQEDQPGAAPLQFFLSYRLTDLPIRTELIKQFANAFYGYGNLEKRWDDSQLNDPADRQKQRVANLDTADFVFALVNADYLASPATRHILDLAQARSNAGKLAGKGGTPGKPYVLITSVDGSPSLSSDAFTSFPKGRSLGSTKPLADDCKNFANYIYDLWKAVQIQRSQLTTGAGS